MFVIELLPALQIWINKVQDIQVTKHKVQNIQVTQKDTSHNN